MERPKVNILSLIEQEKVSEHGFLCVSAPMVRYSKFEFRRLLRKHKVKLCFTPMIIASSFNNSQKARENEFTTGIDDEPVIAQFAAANADEFTMATELIAPYVDGVDLNSGCPQWWAIQKGYGCGLLRKPELVQDIIRTVRRVVPQEFSISLKMRLLGAGDAGLRATIELARQLEKCGVTFITLHGRTMWQRSSDTLNIDAMAAVKQSLQVPLFVNGNVRTWTDACTLYEETKADGVMAARGLLSDPALFDPEWQQRWGDDVALATAQQWLNIANRSGDKIQFQCFHHHLTFMWSSHIQRRLRIEFNNFTNKQQIFQFFDERYNMRPTTTPSDPYQYTKCIYTMPSKGDVYCASSTTPSSNMEWNNSDHSDGKFFNEYKSQVENDIQPEHDDFNLEGSFFTELTT